MNQSKLQIKRLTKNAIIPKKGSVLSAGFDMYASETCKVPSKGKLLIKTGISMAIPYGFYGRIAPRSGLACKKFIDVGAGVVDADYRGEVRVLLFNFGDEDFEILEGDRIAQIILEQIAMVEVEEVEELDSTERGDGGFGSTGKN